MNFIMKWLGWKCEWKLEERVIEGSCDARVYDIFKDTNKDGLSRYKKIRVNNASYGTGYNHNSRLIK